MLDRLLKNFSPKDKTYRTPEGRLVLSLQHHNIDCVLDVGGNVGQTGTELYEQGYTGRVVSFEPSSDAYKTLQSEARKWPNWDIAPQMALGAKDGTVDINLSVTSNWNSIKTVRSEISDIKPKSQITGTETVPVKRLDAIFNDYVTPEERVFVKIDTQGYEAEVLDGCEHVLNRIHGFKIELSLIALYEGEKLYDHFFAWMTDRGFELWIVEDISFSPELGRQLQFDSVFMRPQS